MHATSSLDSFRIVAAVPGTTLAHALTMLMAAEDDDHLSRLAHLRLQATCPMLIKARRQVRKATEAAFASNRKYYEYDAIERLAESMWYDWQDQLEDTFAPVIN